MTDIFSYALQMEKGAQTYYRQMAHRTDNPRLKTILTMLADEEVLHQQVITRMWTGYPHVQAGEVLTWPRDIFTGTKEAEDTLAAEEHKHVVLMMNLIELASRPDVPFGSWLGNAGLYHLDQY